MSWTLRGLVAVLALCMLLTVLYADAPPSELPPQPEPPPDPRLTEDPRDLAFEQYPEPNGIPFEALSSEDQAIATEIGERVETEQGYDVHRRWSHAARSARERARIRRAENAAGIEDADLVGVR